MRTRRKRGSSILLWNFLEFIDTAGSVHALLAADGMLLVFGSAGVQCTCN